jgi:integrase
MAIKITQYAETWLAGRAHKRSVYQDQVRWRKHLAPLVGKLKSDDVTVSHVKGWLQVLRANGLSNSSIRLCISLVSSMYSDLVEEGLAPFNPVKMLSKKTRNEYMRSTHDSRKVPFLPNPTDAYRIYEWLRDNRGGPMAIAYALGAFAGLRTGEIRALRWSDLNFDRKLITVNHSVECVKVRGASLTEDGLNPPKSGLIRHVPMFDILIPILKAASDPSDLVAPGPVRFLRERDISSAILDALRVLGLPEMSFYQATRHTFASQWVLAGGNIHTLSTMLGHHSVTVTESHYVHLVPDRYTAEDRARITVCYNQD